MGLHDTPDDNVDLDTVYQDSRQRVTGSRHRFTNPYTAPWWLAIMILGWIWVIYQMQFNEDYTDAFRQIKRGIVLTLWLALSSYFFALIIGLFTGMLRAYPPRPPVTKLPLRLQVRKVIHVTVYNLVSIYIEFMRGIPPLVFLLIVGFIIVPEVKDAINETVIVFLRRYFPDIKDIVWRARDSQTAIAGLALIYGAFLSEVFRAGIQSVEKGQIEAARSLGMTTLQTMRFIVIPQAVRNVLPPLGNNFISMIKDTSLVTILGTNDITQLARRWSGSQFTYVPTYAVLSVVYLTITVTGSLLVQILERNLRKFRQD